MKVNVCGKIRRLRDLKCGDSFCRDGNTFTKIESGEVYTQNERDEILCVDLQEDKLDLLHENVVVEKIRIKIVEDD